jgi:hypothetical protein
MIADMIKERVQNETASTSLRRVQELAEGNEEWNQHEFSNRFRTCGIMISSSISTFAAFTTVILFRAIRFTNIETYV